MANVSGMNYADVPQIDFEQYQDGTSGSGKSFTPPDEGRYIGRVPAIGSENLQWTAEGNRKLKFDFEIINGGIRPDGTLHAVKFASFSGKKYANREGSQLLDLFRACGVDARPKTWDEYDAIALGLSGMTFEFQLQWEAYNKDTDENIRGQENFPPDPKDPTKRLGYIMDENKRWWANAKIKYTISAIKK